MPTIPKFTEQLIPAAAPRFPLFRLPGAASFLCFWSPPAASADYFPATYTLFLLAPGGPLRIPAQPGSTAVPPSVTSSTVAAHPRCALPPRRRLAKRDQREDPVGHRRGRRDRRPASRRVPAFQDAAAFTPSYSVKFQRRSGTPLPVGFLYVIIVSLICIEIIWKRMICPC